MIHTVKNDDNTRNGKKIGKVLQSYRKGVEPEKPVKSGIIPEGYITSEEFKKRALDKVKRFCDDNGIIE